MLGLIWNAGFALLIYLSFYLTYTVTNNFKLTYKFGLIAYVFSVLWIFGLSEFFVDFKMAIPSKLFYFQLSNISIIFIYSFFKFRKESKDESVIKNLKIVNELKQREVNDLNNQLVKINDDTLNKYASGLRNNELKTIIDSKEHYNFLLNSIREAKIDVLVRSGWANNYVLNVDFISLVRKKLQDGVNFYFGYGYQSANQKNTQQSDSEMKGEFELSQLKEWSIDNKTKGKILVKYFPNHSKLFIVDFYFTACGSFNWLSNGGSTKNLEETWVITNYNFIKERKSILINSFLEK
jgi:hypothetical protein